VAGGVYRRTVRLAEGTGWVAVRPAPRHPGVRVELPAHLGAARAAVVARVRRLADLDALPATIDAHLGRDRALAPLVARHPGLRVPGAFDGFEVAVRAVLGQQVTVRGATTLAGRLVERFGAPLATASPALRALFPAPDVLAAATEREIATLGMPGARARTLIALARAVASEGLRLDPPGDPEEAIAQLLALPGIGDWTAQYVALRALRWPDAFPAGDLGLRRVLGATSARAAERRAERWRPWRAYAALHLWTRLAEGPPRRGRAAPAPLAEACAAASGALSRRAAPAPPPRGRAGPRSARRGSAAPAPPRPR
jgi:AraC family transcriptional regulator, regulatory protein of adaptative response / DNA-3-methyladenine glycosylase II